VSLYATQEQSREYLTPFSKTFNTSEVSTQGTAVGVIDGTGTDGEADGDGDGLIDIVGPFVGSSLGTRLNIKLGN
jgi:hypothetical protein